MFLLVDSLASLHVSLALSSLLGQENLTSGQLGFEVVGGKDDPQFPNDPSLFVSHITKGSAAEGRLRVNDMILKINSLEALNVEKIVALQAMWKSPGLVNMVIYVPVYNCSLGTFSTNIYLSKMLI